MVSPAPLMSSQTVPHNYKLHSWAHHHIHGPVGVTPGHLECPCWTPGFVGACLVLKGPKLASVIEMWSNECWAEWGDNFPGHSSCSCSPVCCWPSLLPGSWRLLCSHVLQGCVCRAAPWQSSPECSIVMGLGGLILAAGLCVCPCWIAWSFHRAI